ncbi:peptidoglycan-binding protein [Gammaproteobacteria bacterium]|nr:peptidoglycan-binding protein [Gammaproteobacteria bacterium]
MKSFLLLGITALTLGACSGGSIGLGSDSAKTPATGSAGGANSENANDELETCGQAIGTLAINEDDGAWWYTRMSRYGINSTVPILRLLAQQSNCFVVVERSRAGLRHIERERGLESSGELRNNSSFGKGQLVAADYTVIPSLTFSENDTGGAGAMLGGLLGSVGTVIGGSLNFTDAQSLLTLVDNRSGVQLAAAEGSARGSSIGGLLGLGGSDASGALSAYTKTPEGKVIVGSMMDAFNNLVVATRNYSAQTVGSANGLGTGGGLAVDGAGGSSANAGGGRALTKRVQAKLNQLGYDVGRPDGIAGKNTTRGLTAFQRDNGLNVSGQMDPATLNLLNP